MKNRVPFAPLAALLAPLSLAAFTRRAWTRPVFLGVDGGNMAVGGYDRVNYFNERRLRGGKRTFRSNFILTGLGYQILLATMPPKIDTDRPMAPSTSQSMLKFE